MQHGVLRLVQINAVRASGEALQVLPGYRPAGALAMASLPQLDMGEVLGFRIQRSAEEMTSWLLGSLGGPASPNSWPGLRS